MSLLSSSIQHELDQFFRQVTGNELPDIEVTDSAFYQKRKKIKYEAYRDVDYQICQAFYDQYPYKTWCGFRLLAIDGSTLKIYGDDYSKRYFGIIDNGSETPYALARVSQCYDVLNHITLDAEISPNSLGERQLAVGHMDKIQSINDLILIDRGYPGFCFFRQILQGKRNFCARVAVGTWTSITEPFLQSGKKEQIIDYIPSKEMKTECRRLGLSSDPMKLRLIRIELPSGETEILITSLLETQRFSYSLFQELYHLRWPVEEAYKLLKCRIEIENFTGKSVLAAKQDFFATILMFNLTSMLIAPMDEKAEKKSVNTKLDYKVNRTQAFAKMKDFGILLFFRESIDTIVQRLHKFFMNKLTAIRLNRRFKRKKNRKISKYGFAYKAIA